MIIAFPPCTYLTAAGASLLYDHNGNVKNTERYAAGEKAAVFFRRFLEADCGRIAVENPRMLKCFGLPGYDQVIEPYMFGHPWRKRTCLWLRGLPPLMPTEWVEPAGLWTGSRSLKGSKYTLSGSRDPRIRARTFPGIARAMAEQWAGLASRSGSQGDCGGKGNMKYKIGDTFMNQLEITAVDEDRTSQYFLSGCQGVGWWSEYALDDLRKMSCGDCKWKGKRHQKCSCCIRNSNMKDNYEY